MSSESRPRIVLPGDELCVEEEFLSSSGTYVENGVVRASVVGTPVFDIVSRRVYVKPAKKISILKPGDIVVGYVTMMRDDVAIVKILGYDLYRPLKTPFTGLLHISQVSEERIATMYDAVRIGDFIKAKVLNDYIPPLLSIKDPKCGVILAFCSRCGAVLVKKGDKLVCRRCGFMDSRKVSLEYMVYEKR